MIKTDKLNGKKMTLIRFITALSPFILMLSSCGDGRNIGESSSNFDSQLSGSWENSCTSNGSFAQEGEIRTWKFLSGRKFEYAVIQYSDSNCTTGNESIVLSGSGTYSLTQEDLQSSIRNIDFSYDKFAAIIKDKDLVAEFNAQEICLIDNWKVDEPVNLYGKKCKSGNDEDVFPGPDSSLSDLIDVDGDRLWLGEKASPLDQSTPTKISDDSYQKI